MSIFGPTYDEDVDRERLERQMDRIRTLMLDGQWRTLPEIQGETGDPEASISAQLRHLRKPQFDSYIVEKRRRIPKCGLWEYKVTEGQPGAQVALGFA